MKQKLDIHPVDAFVGEKLRQRRKKLRLSQSELAEKVSTSHQLLQKYEKGETRISASSLFDLGIILGVTPSYFFEGCTQDYAQDYLPQCDNLIHRNPDVNLHILLVEDDSADELVTRKALQDDEKVILHCVYDGVEALDFLRNFSKKRLAGMSFPDIILLDLNIPKKDGLTFLKEIKMDHDLRYLPIIILTNSVNAKEMLDSYKLYASGYICKSFDFQVFKKDMQNLVEYWRKTVVLPAG